MSTLYLMRLEELREDLERLGKLFAQAPDLSALEKESLEELCGQFLVVMITLEELLDDIYFEHFNDVGAPSEDTSITVLAEFVKVNKLTEQQITDLLDAQTIGFYFMMVPTWIDTYPDIPPNVEDLVETMPSYYDTLNALVKVIEELQQD